MMDKLIKANGQVNFGVFDNPPATINFKEYDLRNVMDKPVTGLRKKMGVNQFQFIGLTGDDLILGVAIVSLKWVSNCFVYVYQPSSKTFKQYSWLKPFSFGVITSNQPNNGKWSFSSGNNKISISANNGARRVKLDIGTALNVDVTIDESTNYNPLAVCCRAGYSGWVFTHKTTALNFTGDINWQGNKIDSKDLLASVDWSCGYMRRETFWLWSSLSCKTEDGTKIGFNLAAGVNETTYTENGLWIDDTLIKLDRAEFIFDRDKRSNNWIIISSDGHINLRFEPEGERKEKINAGFIASNFTQLFGRFYGTVKDQNGNQHDINGATGFCEDHYAKW
jgi:hypothetical protein